MKRVSRSSAIAGTFKWIKKSKRIKEDQRSGVGIGSLLCLPPRSSSRSAPASRGQTPPPDPGGSISPPSPGGWRSRRRSRSPAPPRSSGLAKAPPPAGAFSHRDQAGKDPFWPQGPGREEDDSRRVEAAAEPQVLAPPAPAAFTWSFINSTMTFCAFDSGHHLAIRTLK
jgi:hypothetical protein